MRRRSGAVLVRIDTAEFVRSAHLSDQFVRDDRPEVAFVGRSNVGKSSLLNRLLGRQGLARTSSTPGRTQAVNYFLVNGRFWFVDLPGYGYAKAARERRQEWAALIERYFEERGDDLQVVLLVDGKVGATDLDAQAYEFLASRVPKLAVVATKIDQVPRGKRRASLDGIRRRLGSSEEMPLIPFSARSGEGVGELWRELSPHVVEKHR
jgi:GTP-binding protein